jgi:hypothetical protein
MTDWQTFVAVVIISSQSLLVAPQLSNPSISASQVNKNTDADVTTVPEWLPFPIPAALYEKWRKYGQWDYKQQGFSYRDFTQFNFGATGGAAGIDQKSLLALAQAVKPTREDVNGLDNPDLQVIFTQKAEGLERLRSMAEQDSHVIRIASDFTLLDTNTEWPRKDLGFSQARWSEYRLIFKNLSLSEGIVRTADFPDAIFFVGSGQGTMHGRFQRWLRLFDQGTHADGHNTGGSSRRRRSQEREQTLRICIQATEDELVCVLRDRLVVVYTSQLSLVKPAMSLTSPCARRF